VSKSAGADVSKCSDVSCSVVSQNTEVVTYGVVSKSAAVDTKVSPAFPVEFVVGGGVSSTRADVSGSKYSDVSCISVSNSSDVSNDGGGVSNTRADVLNSALDSTGSVVKYTVLNSADVATNVAFAPRETF